MQHKILIGILFVLLIASLFFWQDVMELLSEEPRRAVVALEMDLTGNYVVPEINGVTYYNKPPLFNWVIAGFYRITGSYQEWVVRLPSLIALMLTSVFSYFVVSTWINKQTALLAAFFTLTAADIYFYGSIYSGDIDLFFMMVVYLQVISLFWFFQRKRFLWMFLISYLFMGAGFLTKGMPSLAFQFFTLLGMAVMYRQWRWLFTWKHLSGILLFLLPAGLYYFFYSKEADPLIYGINLVKEASQRTALESTPGDFVRGFLSFPLAVIVLILPWSLLGVYMIRRNITKQLIANELVRFALIFLLFNLPIYWLTGELRNRYLYMFVPFFMTILAYIYDRFRNDLTVVNRWVERFIAGILFLLPVIFLVPLFLPETRDLPLAVWWSGILCAGSFGVAILSATRLKGSRIFLLVLGLVMIRIGVNVFYLPAYVRHDPYVYFEQQADAIVSVTETTPVHLAGNTVDYYLPVSLGKWQLKTLRYSYPEIIPFHLTYYISRKNHQVVSYDSVPIPGVFYLGREEFLQNRNYTEYYRYFDLRTKSNVLLVKMVP